MRQVVFFMMVSANGFYERGPWEIDWHVVDAEFNDFAVAQLRAADVLLFGRRTFEGMASYWPTPEAIAEDRQVAELMNEKPKIVFSRTIEHSAWSNTRIVKGDAATELRGLKAGGSGDLLLLGSSDLATSLAAADLIDEYRLMVAPVALPAGKAVLQGLAGDLRLRVEEVRPFASGNVLVRYRPRREVSASSA
jgi:dihydrofolate reductase